MIRLFSFVFVGLMCFAFISGCDFREESITRQLKDTIYTPAKIEYPNYKLFTCFGENELTCDISNRVSKGKEFFQELTPQEAIAFSYDADVKDIHIIGYEREDSGFTTFVFEFGNDNIERNFDRNYRPNVIDGLRNPVILAKCDGNDPYYCLVSSEKINHFHLTHSESKINVSRGTEDYLTPIGTAATESGWNISSIDVIGYAFKQDGTNYVIYRKK